MTTHADLAQHYRDLAEQYTEAYFLTEGYRQWLTAHIIRELEVQQDDRCVDLAGGTGVIADMIHTRAGLQHDILCVDLCREMLDEAQQRHGVFPFCSDACEFVAREDVTYNKLLLKEAIHHFPDRVRLFSGIYRQLAPQGRLLIITRPPRTAFPFFEAAHRAFERGQPPSSIFQEELKHIGFEMTTQIHSFPLTIPQAQWYQMLTQRFMSHLSLFTDEQIQEGIEELTRQFPDTDLFRFSDNLVFITGKKPL